MRNIFQKDRESGCRLETVRFWLVASRPSCVGMGRGEQVPTRTKM